MDTLSPPKAAPTLARLPARQRGEGGREGRRAGGGLLLGTLRGSGRLPGPSLTQRERGSPGLASRGRGGGPAIGLRSRAAPEAAPRERTGIVT